MRHLRVGVLMGGRSVEREVSLNSGRTICDHLDTSRYSISPIFQSHTGQLYILPWHFLHRGKISDFEWRLEGEAQKITWDDLKNLIDFAYIAMHGRFAEDGTLQGMLELLHIPYMGSKVFASALGMDKITQKKFLRMAGILVPNDITMYPHEIPTIDQAGESLALRLSEKKLTYPLIVKPAQEGSSFGVSKVHSFAELIPAIKKASRIQDDKKIGAVLIEECIKGMEFSCIVITHATTGELIPLPPTEIEIEAGKTFFDYDQKYMPGRATKHTPARCSSEQIALMQKTSCAVMQALGFTTIARIDGFLTPDNTIVITDPNTLSGMAPSSYAFLQAAEHNMTHTDFINHLIETEINQYGLYAGSDACNEEQQKNNATEGKKLRVGVLLGGTSNEKEISLESGRNVCYKLSPHKYIVTPLFVNKDLDAYAIDQKLLVRNKTTEIEEGLRPDMKIPWNKLPDHFDFIFIGLHGAPGENGVIQGALEMLGLPYNGSPIVPSALCMDKYKTNDFLRSAGFEIPEHYLLSREEWDSGVLKGSPIVYPVIVKPHDDGCSVGVKKARNDQEFVAAANEIFATNKMHVLVEECVIGTELTIGVLGNETARALPPSEAIAAGGILSIEEKFLPGAGENQTPANIPAHARDLACKTMEEVYIALGCKGYVRIDCFYQTASQNKTGKERIVILEINTLPGLTPATCIFHQAAEIGLKPMDLIDIIVQLGLEYHTQSPHLTSDQKVLLQRA